MSKRRGMKSEVGVFLGKGLIDMVWTEAGVEEIEQIDEKRPCDLLTPFLRSPYDQLTINLLSGLSGTW